METFKPVKGARLTQEQAEKYGARLLKLARASDGVIHSGDVVADAKKKGSPLHNYFDWDTKTAAVKWWDQQARYLLRSIAIQIERDDQVIELRLTHNVIIQEERGYKDIGTIVTDDNLIAQVIAQALAELRSWTEKYATYQELSSLRAEVVEALAQFGA